MKWVSTVALAICTLLLITLTWQFGILGFFAASGWSLVTVLLQNYDKALQISSYFLSFFSSFSNWAERRTVTHSIQGTINLSAAKINSESAGLLPHTVKVEIVKPTDRETFLRDGEIVVCMESSRNQARNLARATLFFVSEDLVRDSRRFIDRIIMRACDLAIARKMLMAEHKIDAITCLNDEFLNPETERDPSLRSYVLAMDEMDSHGTFTRILLREFSELGAKLSPKLSDRQAGHESKTFADKLGLLARKQTGIDVDPTHEGQIFRIAIMPIARAELTSISPHLKYAHKCYSRKIPILYILARGQINIVQSKAVLAEIEFRRTYRKITDWDFSEVVSGEVIPSYIAVCAIVTDKVATHLGETKGR